MGSSRSGWTRGVRRRSCADGEGLERNATAAGEEVDEVGEDDGSDGGDEDADDEAMLAGAAVAEGAEDGSANDRADEALSSAS